MDANTDEYCISGDWFILLRIPTQAVNLHITHKAVEKLKTEFMSRKGE